jgi:hypothetical protein
MLRAAAGIIVRCNVQQLWPLLSSKWGCSAQYQYVRAGPTCNSNKIRFRSAYLTASLNKLYGGGVRNEYAVRF